MKADISSDPISINTCSLSLHNRLVSQYRILIGEEKTETSDNSVEGFDIEPSIDTSCLGDKTLSHILAVFHHFVNNGEEREDSKKRLSNVEADKPCEMVDHLKEDGAHIDLKKRLRNVDVDKPCKMMDYLVQKINCDNARCNSYSLFVDAYNQLKRDLQQEFDIKYTLEMPDTWESYIWKINFFAEELLFNLHLYSYKVGKVSPTFQVWLYMDLCCWAILQFVRDGIMLNKQVENKLESIEKLNTEIVRLIKKEKEKKNLIKLDGSPEEIMFKLFSYYYEKDRYLQDIEILDYIEKSRERQNPSSDKYSLVRFSPQWKTLCWSKILDLFSEGEPGKKEDSFKECILKCHKGIYQFIEISGRRLVPDPITLRAFYKEIYMDKTRFNTKSKPDNPRQSKSIFHKFLKDKDMTNGDYYFIDEKINAGMYREYGLINEFHEKNNMQRNLYCLICYFLAVLNPEEMIDKFKGALEDISEVIAEIYYEGTSIAESGTRKKSEEEEILELMLAKIINQQKKHVEKLTFEHTKITMMFFFGYYNLKFPDGQL